MKKMSTALTVLGVALLSLSLSFGNPALAAQQSDDAKQANYLPLVKKSIVDNVGSIEDYGNFYLDHKNGLKFVLELVKNDEKSEKLKKDLQSKLPADLLQIRTDKKHTKKEQVSLNKELFTRWKDIQNSKDTDIVKTYVDDESGKVIIVASKITNTDKQGLLDRYGDKIEVVVDPSVEKAIPASIRNSKQTTLGGGIGINSNVGACSIAALGTKSGTKYMITAGHCLSGTGTNTVYQYSGSSEAVGTDHYSGYNNGAGIDIGLVKITDTNRLISNGVVMNSTTAYDGSISYTGNVYGGEDLYKSGITTNLTRSRVTSTSVNVYVGSVLCTDEIETSNTNDLSGGGVYINGGDSGGTVWYSSNLVGVVSAYTSTKGYIAKISYVSSLLGVTVYTSSTPQ